MFISSRAKVGLFSFLSFLLLFDLYVVHGQVSETITDHVQQQNKINSIKINNIVTSDNIEQPADSESVVISKKITNLNSKYVTQSTITSGPAVGLYQKKSEYT
jgi:hypothetical protein